MSDDDDREPWRDPTHPSYRGPKTKRCLGCRLPCAKSAWGAWCCQCNVARIKRIDKDFAAVAKALGVKL